MPGQDSDELKDSGGQRAIWLALRAAVLAHPDPRRAVQAALSAVEAERVRQLHSTQEWGPWGEGFEEGQRALSLHLPAVLRERPTT